MQNALKVIEVSGEVGINSGELDYEVDPAVKVTGSVNDTKTIYVSAEEIASANLMVASMERSRLDPFRRDIEAIETSIAKLNRSIAEQREKLAAKKTVLKMATKSFGRVQLRLEKLTNGDMNFDEFVTKLHG